MQLSRAFLVVTMGFVGFSAHAQPTELRPDGVAAMTVATDLVKGPDGGFQVLVRSTEVASGEVVARRPADAPVRTKLESGEYLEGLVLTLDHPWNGEAVTVDLPESINIQLDGTYRANIVRRSLGAESLSRLPGSETRIRLNGTATVPIVYDPAPGEALPPGWQRVPTNVTRSPEGAFAVGVSAIGPVSGGAASRAAPLSVPVWTKRPDGKLEAGLYFENNTTERRAELIVATVEVRPDNAGFRAHLAGGSAVHRTGTDLEGSTFPPGYREKAARTEQAPVVWTEERHSMVTRGTFSLTLATGATGNLTPAQIDQVNGAPDQIGSVPLVQTVANFLVRETVGTGLGNIDFVGGLPATTLAQTTTHFRVAPYSSSAQGLAAAAFFDDESAEEQSMYENLPPGSCIPVHYSLSFDIDACQLRVPNSLTGQLFLPANTVFFDIRFNQNVSFNYDHAAKPTGNQSSFIHILMHEVIHGFGFTSQADIINAPGNPFAIWPLDVFIFSEPGAGQGINGFQFFSQRRNLTLGERRALVTLLGSSHWYRMELLDSSHFAPPFETGGICTGIMIQYEDPSCRPSGLVKEADVRALDAIGWVIDTDNLPLPPSPPQCIEPAAGANVQTLTPTLVWSSPGGADVHNVFVLPATGETPLLVARDLQSTQSTLAVPQGTLVAGQTYRWYVSSRNSAGIDFSQTRSFNTVCPADFNQSGDVTIQDIYDFLAAYFVPLTTADINGDGSVSVQDLLDFLQHYFAGC